MACKPALMRHTFTYIVRSSRPLVQCPATLLTQHTPNITPCASFHHHKYREAVEKGKIKSKRQEMLEDMKKKYEKEMDERYAGVHRESLNQLIHEFVPEGWSIDRGKHAFRSLYALRMIKTEDASVKKFDSKSFALEAQKKFIDLNNEFQQPPSRIGDFRLLENATQVMVNQLKKVFRGKKRSSYWRFVKATKPPKCVFYAVTKDEKEQLTAQVTVELNILQIGAVQDKLGHVWKGCKQNPVEVTHYIVLEKFLPDPYAPWRICGKVEKKKTDTKAIAAPSTSDKSLATSV